MTGNVVRHRTISIGRALNVALLLAAAFPATAAEVDYWDAAVREEQSIVAAQRALAAEGHDTGPANGTLNVQTAQALSAAQKDRELEPTGQLDRRTLAALGIDVEERATPARSAQTAPGASGTGSCDTVFGPEKQSCLRRGGTVTTSGETGKR
jgi:peptidoglycan hydrolase-like protein with peptidoglycan-binding domain